MDNLIKTKLQKFTSIDLLRNVEAIAECTKYAADHSTNHLRIKDELRNISSLLSLQHEMMVELTARFDGFWLLENDKQYWSKKGLKLKSK